MLWERVDGRVTRCCEVLRRAGFEVYPVGGCVRDLLLGHEPDDWDVTTNAAPEQVMNLFNHTVPTGVKHGTITVIVDGIQIEVTTFRTETGYSDGRHPDAVRFTATLAEDLARRDFTMNAMALERDGTVLDPFGGQVDLAKGIIRCVGEPTRRFEEDGLRMFRAVRFVAQLGLSVEKNTMQAIRDRAHTAGRIAAERVQTELDKTLCSSRPEVMGQFFELGLLSTWTGGHPADVARLNLLPNERLLRWAGLCACLRRGSEPEPEAFLKRMKLDGGTLRACEAGLQLLECGLPQTRRDWRHALARFGEDACRSASAMAVVTGQTEALALLEQVLRADPCIKMAQLALSGGELTELGLSGPAVGQMQRKLLDHVLDHPGDNTRDALMKIVLELM